MEKIGNDIKVLWNYVAETNKPQSIDQFPNIEEPPKQVEKPSLFARMLKDIPNRFLRSTTTPTENLASSSLPKSKITHTITIGKCAGLADTREVVIRGSCFCKDIEYELLEFPKDIQHCYCLMCRKMHGAAVTSWCPMHEKNIRWIKKSKENLKTFQSSQHTCRYFCGRCSANVALKYDFQCDSLWLTAALSDEQPPSFNVNTIASPWYESCRILHIFCHHRAKWYPLPQDGQPQLGSFNIDLGNDDNNGSNTNVNSHPISNDPSNIPFPVPPKYISLPNVLIPPKPVKKKA